MTHQHIHILYTDGHEVTVTDSFFQVKKALYQLKGITNHGLRVIHPDRLFPFLTLLLGAMLITMGALHLIPGSAIQNIHFESIEMTANTFVLGLGIALFVAGGLMFCFMKPRYAIRIATAEGEKNVLVSRKREYIALVVDALNKAFLSIVAPKHQKTKLGLRKK